MLSLMQLLLKFYWENKTPQCWDSLKYTGGPGARTMGIRMSWVRLGQSGKQSPSLNPKPKVSDSSEFMIFLDMSLP